MEFFEALGSLGTGQLAILLIALGIAFAFECINGFHDTANAVATVIYTRSLRPTAAVVWSGIWNFIGVYAGGIGVAFSIVHLLPVDLLVDIRSGRGLAMVLALLVSAITWNFATWYKGLPASSSHALIGSIMGVGMMNAWLERGSPFKGVNWHKVTEVITALLLSPMIGFLAAAILLWLCRSLIRSPRLFRPPTGDEPPPWWVRALLVGTCTGVSFAHGSNDGQKGMGLVMLILIGILPATYALDPASRDGDLTTAVAAAGRLEGELARPDLAALMNALKELHVANARVERLSRSAALAQEASVESDMVHRLVKPLEGGDPVLDTLDPLPVVTALRDTVGTAGSSAELSPEQRWRVRTALVELGTTVRTLLREFGHLLPRERRDDLKAIARDLARPVEYVPSWVVLGVALCLGLGTMVGWERIVVTVGEKIGKSHLTYAQGAVAELIAATTIGMADRFHMPVSTTHVLSSGVAGTMWAERAGLQRDTVRKIALAWVLTLPAVICLAGALYWLATMVVA
ncbi:MAG: inorganic phosphate transporter [Planctomycetota bacterium]